jgi:hypothetical protein
MRLSDSREVLLRLRWLAILSGLLKKTKLAVTGGVHTATDAIKTVMCGAAAVQVVAGVLRSGPERLRTMRVEMESWMAEHEYKSVESMRGCMNILRAPNLDYEGQPVRVIRAEYLIALYLEPRARTAKRLGRVAVLLEEGNVDRELLNKLLRRYNLRLPKYE